MGWFNYPIFRPLAYEREAGLSQAFTAKHWG
eukprot:CAMPEP_0180134264 /NCGR_PEP_ID=MMETSP0986-20121125/10051_1 /TAXON_ID=697907 /ORGANISM="non described non described, Strain CCMP2293" /LENGTH=30 /DNA_ID= /DNA_START= /DNA_END= /DNA_ORIENTATION=